MAAQEQGQEVLESVSGQEVKRGKKASVQHYLATPGLPTVPTKLAQRIWDIDFIEME